MKGKGKIFPYLTFIYSILYFHAQSLSHVWLFFTLCTVAQEAHLSMGFSNQEY